VCECVCVGVCICAVGKSSYIRTTPQREIGLIISQIHKYIKTAAKLAVMERNVVICTYVGMCVCIMYVCM